MPCITILVDADACPAPVLTFVLQLKTEFELNVVTVASYHHHIRSPHHITVGDTPDAADYAIVQRVRPGDIVVTQDWGLAALVLAKKASAISPMGHVYDSERIDFMLDERHKKARLRRSGGRTKGPKARSRQDDAAFEHALRRLLSSASVPKRTR